MSPSFPPTSQLQEPSPPLPAASQRLLLPGWLRRGVAKSVPFLALQSNVVSFRLFSPPSSQTPHSQKCPFASRPPVHAPSMQLCLRSLRALRCAYCRGRPIRRPSTLKKKKKRKRKERKRKATTKSFRSVGNERGRPASFHPSQPQPPKPGARKEGKSFSWLSDDVPCSNGK